MSGNSINVLPIFGVFLWAFVPAFIAAKKERSFWGYFFLSLIITPLLTMIIILCLPSLADPAESKKERTRKEREWKKQLAEDEARKAGHVASLLLIQGVDDYGECPNCHARNRIGSLKCSNCGLLLKPEIDGQMVVPVAGSLPGFVECPVCHNNQVAGAEKCFKCKVKFITTEQKERMIAQPVKAESTKESQGEIASVQFCRRCGSKLSGKCVFCNKCGLKVVEVNEK